MSAFSRLETRVLAGQGKETLMSAGVFRFEVGNLRCRMILDGIGHYPPGMFFTNLPNEQYEPRIVERGQSPGRMNVPVICLLIEAEDGIVLVDTGARTVVPGAGKLVDRLRSEGIEPQDIDVVVLSHAHGDHIAGNLSEDGAPAFANARYVISEEEWDFWMSDPSLAELPIDAEMRAKMAAFARTNLVAIKARLDPVKPETEVLLSVSLLPLFGHTPGHTGLEIRSAGERCLFVADAIIDPIHVEHPEARAITDHQPDEMVRTRFRILERAAKEKALIAASHFPFPGVGYVEESGCGWRWQPASAAYPTRQGSAQ